METDTLIRRLAETAEPMRPLLPPWTRAAAWLAIAIPYVALVVYVMAPRDDLSEKIWQSRFLVEQLAALATAITAAASAFAATVPGYNRKILIWPAVSLGVWLGSLGQGCVQDWLKYGAAGLSFRPDWFCFPAIVLVGAVPAIAMAVMLRRGAPLMPCMTVALGGLAAAGLGNFGLRLFHPQDASLMVLVWQFGSVFVLAAIAGIAGRRLLNWAMIVRPSRRRAIAQ